MAKNDTETQDVVDVDVVETNTQVKYLDRKETVMEKIKKHKELILGVLIGGGVAVGAKVLKSLGSKGKDNSDDDFVEDDFDVDFDDTGSTDVE